LDEDKEEKRDEERFFLGERYTASAGLAVEGERDWHSTGEMLRAAEVGDEARTAIDFER